MNNCSGSGRCVRVNTCDCKSGFKGSPDCSEGWLSCELCCWPRSKLNWFNDNPLNARNAGQFVSDLFNHDPGYRLQFHLQCLWFNVLHNDVMYYIIVYIIVYPLVFSAYNTLGRKPSSQIKSPYSQLIATLISVVST